MDAIHQGPVMRIVGVFFVVKQVTQQLAGDLKRHDIHTMPV